MNLKALRGLYDLLLIDDYKLAKLLEDSLFAIGVSARVVPTLRDRNMRWQPNTLLFGLRLWIFLEVFLSCSPASATGKTAADYYVKSLPGQPDGPLLNMHAG